MVEIVKMEPSVRSKSLSVDVMAMLAMGESLRE